MKLFFLLFLVSTQAAALGCPREIKDKQTLLKSSSSWQVKLKSGPRYLESVDVTQGHPSKFQFIERRKINSERSEWQFPKKSDIWVTCRYENSAYSLILHVGQVSECSFLEKHPKVHGGAYFLCKK